jgi:hypothetical protein
MVSLAAGAAPLYAMPNILVPVLSLNNSAAKCGAVPLPADA